MNIILCLDERNGMMFNNRRQSRDGAVCRRVLECVWGRNLWMNEYSSKLFDGADIKISSDFLMEARKGDFCFVENPDFLEYEKDFEKVIVYRWNRVYPADVRIDEDFLKKRRLVSTFDFCGDSHDKITEEIYEV